MFTVQPQREPEAKIQFEIREKVRENGSGVFSNVEGSVQGLCNVSYEGLRMVSKVGERMWKMIREAKDHRPRVNEKNI